MTPTAPSTSLSLSAPCPILVAQDHTDPALRPHLRREAAICALCGVLGASEHWADAHHRRGAFTRNTDPAARRRERARRVSQANRLLKPLGLALSDWQGSAFLLANRTGKTAIVGDLAELWAAAERLLGRPVDPLDPALLDRLGAPTEISASVHRSVQEGTLPGKSSTYFRGDPGGAPMRAPGAGPAATPRPVQEDEILRDEAGREVGHPGDDARTPVFVLTGFLGSGKTTLLSRLLRDPALSDSAVLINEFGEVGLDHRLVERIDDATVLLGSGCLCCTVRGELSAAIRDLLSRRERAAVPPFRRLVMETTGLADPAPILSTLVADPVLRHHARLGAVVTAVDAVNGLDQLRRQPESIAQVALADRLVLTKTDLCADGASEALIDALRAVNPDAPLLVSAAPTFAPAALLGERAALHARLAGLRCLPVADDNASHLGDVASFALVLDGALDWTAFALWLSLLLQRHGDRLLRVKGLLRVGGTEGPVAIHGVGPLVHPPTHLAAWPDDDRRSRLVFITRGLDPSLVERSLKVFGVLTPG